MLFPINIALNIFVWFSINFKTILAFFTFSSAIDFILILFTVVRHVSADEKKAERTNRINSVIILQASLESKKKSTPIILMYNMNHCTIDVIMLSSLQKISFCKYYVFTIYTFDQSEYTVLFFFPIDTF